MAEQGFLSRWSRLKGEAREAPRREPDVAPAPPPDACLPAAIDAPGDDPAAQPRYALPTLEDAMRLGPDSDYSAFVARGVDPLVRRHALRTLFSDPHFNVIDGLDVYMGDYTRSDPIPPAMLASLQHADAWLRSQLNDNAEAAQPDPSGAQQGYDQHHRPDDRHGRQDHQQATAPDDAPAREHDEY